MSKLKVIFLKGLPGSGKSTWAKEFLQEHANYIITNKDTLRENFPGTSEKNIIAMETSLVNEALRKGCNVIIDNTHLNPIHEERYRKICLEYGADFEIHDMNVDPMTCLLQNRQRDGKARVPDKAITGMYKQYIYKEPKGFNSRGNIVICDIDGTLAFKGDRDIYDYTKVECDFPNNVLIKILRMFIICNYKVVFLSGREKGCYSETSKWIIDHFRYYEFELYMREEGDKRDDVIVKQELLDKYIKREDVFCVFDDRPKVVRMWKSLGFYVFNCNQEPWNIEF